MFVIYPETNNDGILNKNKGCLLQCQYVSNTFVVVYYSKNNT